MVRAALYKSRTPMTREQLNRTGMFSAVSAYMGNNQSLWNSLKAIKDTVTDLDSGIEAIDDAIGKQQTSTTGAATAKAQVRHDFEEKLLVMAGQLSALAAVNKNANLASQVEFTLSSLDKLADDKLEEVGKNVATLTTANLAALADYGVAQADVTELNTLTTQFHAVKTAPRTAVAGRAGQTATLPELIANVTSLLRNRLDKLMMVFRKTNPEFYAGYQSARVIVDRGGGNHAHQAQAAQAAPAAQ